MFTNAPDREVTGLCFDSRKVKPGDVYFCLPGLTFDGHDFIDQAVSAGAAAVVHSRPVENPKPGAVYLKVDDTVGAMNQAAKLYYGSPSDSMKMIGVTGTNGKSTITNIVRYFLNPTMPCGYIGTIAIAYGDVRLEPDLTTPDSIFLQKTMKDMQDAGMQAVSMEVSSHGLAQRRVEAIDFDTAVFTNFTYDHLDFHGTLEDYFLAKSILFKERVKPDGISILNVDDEKYEELKDLSIARIVTYGIDKNADYRAENLNLSAKGSTFDLIHNGTVYPVKTNLAGRFNIYNLLAAIASVHETVPQISIDQIVSMCETVPQIPGRLEQIDAGQPYTVIVDFAHTPDGMEKVMQYGKVLTQGKGQLIAVFGSAGKRDKAKRKVFGQLADQYCNSVILTEDDPRDEDPVAIIEEIRSGMTNTPSLMVPDRYEAIRQAIESANPDDVILLLGKGDEDFIYYANGREPWIGDNKAARECIERRMQEEA
jgi:UDP-N-acetylmuramoyl-L-alanyl-D-glutamate--2,6-diaminopimelate ligase